MKYLFTFLMNRVVFVYAKLVGKPNIYFKRIGLKVGTNCRIYPFWFGSEPYLITIGNNVTITSGVNFITHDGSASLMRDSKGRRYVFQPIEIGNNVFVGANSTLMPGVKIEDNVIVAAGAVVTKSIPSGTIVAGVPAKIIGSFDNLRTRMIDEYISEEELNGIKGTEKERIMKNTTYQFKPYLKE